MYFKFETMLHKSYTNIYIKQAEMKFEMPRCEHKTRKWHEVQINESIKRPPLRAFGVRRKQSRTMRKNL